ncbi:Uncharacterized conserved protein UCP012943 [Cinnamomum micranthum f. kanehirae]|uniref:Uncharacterized conserved protein UCP012943 n=1 Tax=Cinnamomum micranthum f. kanehirae TaxID=337451 RepID=A0A3S3RAJ1_9MAGN|nr:Uncharacterized conserved protein UCP012943 [Cinnamomum micranthum f. kanehirae]
MHQAYFNLEEKIDYGIKPYHRILKIYNGSEVHQMDFQLREDNLQNSRSSSSASCGECAEDKQMASPSHQSEPLSMGYPETKLALLLKSAAINPSVSKPVLDAFYLLKESPEVQNIVASLAADTNVWEAVMKNEKVMEFYQSQKTAGVLLSNLNEDMVESYAANGYLTSSDESVEQSSETSGNRFTRLVDNIKMQVAKMVTNLSEFFQNLFKTSAEECSSVDAERGSTDFMDKAAGASFIALGILAIVVVLLKRK